MTYTPLRRQALPVVLTDGGKTHPSFHNKKTPNLHKNAKGGFWVDKRTPFAR